jgi:hypothetical protein
MRLRPQPVIMSGTYSDYVKTHCGTCAAGWMRSGEEMGTIYACLLDREPVPPKMELCDRYEVREGIEDGAAPATDSG